AQEANLRMMRAVLDQHLRHLLGSGDSHVCDDTAVQSMRVIEINNGLGEVGAVFRDGMKVRDVRGFIQFLDQCKVLLRGGLDFKSIDRAIVRGSDKLVPISARSSAVFEIWSEVFEVCATIPVAQEGGHLRVSEERNIFRTVD